MFRLVKEFTFEASHQLPDHDGKCRRLHGHSWRGRLILEGTTLQPIGPKKGMLIDYADVKAALEPLVNDYLDHYHLNDSTGLDNPTSENLAKWIYYRLAAKLPLLKAVEILETCTCSCTYTPEEK